MKNSMLIVALLFAASLSAQTLSKNEQADILLMREEEKMARDLYQAFNEKWDAMPFAHISESEIRHMAEMKTLVDKFSLADPVERTKDIRGAFENTTLQQLYNELHAWGITSAEAAFRAGAKVEEVDIRDLEAARANAANEQIKSTYDYLIMASENHLRAFVRNLQRLGVNYTPVLMDQAEFDAIIGGKQGMGMGNGRGPGNGNGKGKGACCNKPS